MSNRIKHRPPFAALLGLGAVIASTDFKRELNYGKENIGCDLWK